MEKQGEKELDIYTFPNLFRDYWLFLRGRRFWFIFWSLLRSLSTAAGFGIASASSGGSIGSRTLVDANLF